MEGLIFGGAYQRREICVSKSIGLCLYLKVNIPFLSCFALYLRAIFQVQAPGGLYLEGRFNWGFFALPIWRAYIWRALYEGLIFGILRYLLSFWRPYRPVTGQISRLFFSLILGKLNIRSKYFPTAIACLLSPTPCLKLFVQPGICLYLWWRRYNSILKKLACGCLLDILLGPVWTQNFSWAEHWIKVAEHSLPAVSGNSRDGACFKLDKQTWCRKSNGTQNTICQNLVIRILWYLPEFLL